MLAMAGSTQSWSRTVPLMQWLFRVVPSATMLTGGSSQESVWPRAGPHFRLACQRPSRHTLSAMLAMAAVPGGCSSNSSLAAPQAQTGEHPCSSMAGAAHLQGGRHSPFRNGAQAACSPQQQAKSWPAPPDSCHAALAGLCSGSSPMERGGSLHALFVGSGWTAAQPCNTSAMLCRLADQFTEEVAWTPLNPSTQLSIMRDPGLVNSTAHRKLSLAVSSNGTEAAVGVVNSGYWGIPVDSGSAFVLSMRIKRLDVSDTAAKVRRLASASLLTQKHGPCCWRCWVAAACCQNQCCTSADTPPT